MCNSSSTSTSRLLGITRNTATGRHSAGLWQHRAVTAVSCDGSSHMVGPFRVYAAAGVVLELAEGCAGGMC